MSRLYRDEAIVLRTYKLGEADHIVILLSAEHGQHPLHRRQGGPVPDHVRIVDPAKARAGAARRARTGRAETRVDPAVAD